MRTFSFTPASIYTGVVMVLCLAFHASGGPAPKCVRLIGISSKTVIVNHRYVCVPHDFSDQQRKKIEEILPDRHILAIAANGGKLYVSVVEETKPAGPRLISGRELQVDPKTWDIENPVVSRFSDVTPDAFLAEDQRIWRAFMPLARRTATANGIRLSRSHGVFFVPGKSFTIQNGTLMLRYFKGSYNSKPDNIRDLEPYATIQSDSVRGLKAAEQDAAADADRPRR
jgi:hypothetical protein